jgi:hypothetical protein
LPTTIASGDDSQQLFNLITPCMPIVKYPLPTAVDVPDPEMLKTPSSIQKRSKRHDRLQRAIASLMRD